MVTVDGKFGTYGISGPGRMVLDLFFPVFQAKIIQKLLLLPLTTLKAKKRNLPVIPKIRPFLSLKVLGYARSGQSCQK